MPPDFRLENWRPCRWRHLCVGPWCSPAAFLGIQKTDPVLGSVKCEPWGDLQPLMTGILIMGSYKPLLYGLGLMSLSPIIWKYSWDVYLIVFTSCVMYPLKP